MKKAGPHLGIEEEERSGEAKVGEDSSGRVVHRRSKGTDTRIMVALSYLSLL